MDFRTNFTRVLQRVCTIAAAIVLTTFACAATLSDQQAHERAKSIVERMSIEDKIDFLSGGGLFNTKAMPQYGIPAFLMTDGPSGTRLPPPTTAYAAGIGLAATWDTAMAHEVGVQLGRDARSRSVSFLLGPGVNIYRAPMNGRNFEYFGEDPFLASRVAVNYIEGVQAQGVSATIKHFAANNSEFARRSSNSVVDERTLREIYLPAFEAAVKEAHVDAVMSSYNRVNGEHSTQNSLLNQTVLRQDWGFEGILMSDWDATHEGLSAAKAGLDLEMPFGTYMRRDTLLSAIHDGKLTESTIDEKVEHILYIAALRGYLDASPLDTRISRLNQEGAAVALHGAEEGMVLLKNENHLLPIDLSKVKTIAVIGPNANPSFATAGGSGQVPAFQESSVLTGLSNALAGRVNVTYARGIPTLAKLSGSTSFHTAPGGKTQGVTVETFPGTTFAELTASTRIELTMSSGRPFLAAQEFQDIVDNLTLPQIAKLMEPPPPTVSRWTGYYTVKGNTEETVFAEASGKYRLLVDDNVLIDQSTVRYSALVQKHLRLSAGEHKVVFEELGNVELGAPFFRVGIHPDAEMIDPYALKLAKEADVIVLCLGFQPDVESESMDRPFDLPPGQDELVREAVALNSRVVVALTSGGSVDVQPWIAKAQALVELWYPGQDGGCAFANVLLGKVNPSGHLPISWEKSLADNPSFENYYFNDPSRPDDVVYREGVFTGYRGYDRSGVKPQYPFGFGLSYTQFSYRDLKVSQNPDRTIAVSFVVRNVGGLGGAAVPQIYVAPPTVKGVELPVKTLAGFSRVTLAPGEERAVSVILPARSFTYFDVGEHRWRAPEGKYTVELGDSSDHVLDQSVVELSHPFTIPIDAR